MLVFMSLKEKLKSKYGMVYWLIFRSLNVKLSYFKRMFLRLRFSLKKLKKLKKRYCESSSFLEESDSDISLSDMFFLFLLLESDSCFWKCKKNK